MTQPAAPPGVVISSARIDFTISLRKSLRTSASVQPCKPPKPGKFCHEAIRCALDPNKASFTECNVTGASPFSRTKCCRAARRTAPQVVLRRPHRSAEARLRSTRSTQSTWLPWLDKCHKWQLEVDSVAWSHVVSVVSHRSN